VAHYDLTLSYNVDSNHLRGKAVLSAEAASDLRELRLDLSGLRVTKVTVDGAGARFVAKRST
jgi:aminopeptidase N